MNTVAKVTHDSKAVDFLKWRCEVPYRRRQYDPKGMPLKGSEAFGTVTWLMGFGSTQARAERMAEETCKRHRISSMEDVRRNAEQNELFGGGSQGRSTPGTGVY